MSRSLSYSIEHIFNTFRPSCGGSTPSQEVTPRYNTNTVYMEIPLKGDSLELPCFVLANDDICNNLNNDAVVVPLNSLDRVPYYATIGAYMKEILVESIREHGLIKLTTTERNTTKTYYATYGAIFDDSFSPILLCSWKVSKQETEGGEISLQKEIPIIRVSSQCYLSKANQIERFIANKFIQTALESKALGSGTHLNSSRSYYALGSYACLKNLHIEIADMPFNLRKVETPSISTSNEELLQIARDHINEILQ